VVVRRPHDGVTTYDTATARGSQAPAVGDGARSTGVLVNGRPAVDDLLELYDAEVDRLLAYLCAADRTLTHVDAENAVHRAVLALQSGQTRTDQFGGPVLALFVSAQRFAAEVGHVNGSAGPAALAESIAPWPDHPDVVRLQVLQEALDQVPDVQRRIVLLRELCRFSAPETGLVMELADSVVESTRGDALRGLMQRLDQGIASRVARGGPLSPDDFVALTRVLRRSERRRTSTRQRLADALACAATADGATPAGSSPIGGAPAVPLTSPAATAGAPVMTSAPATMIGVPALSGTSAGAGPQNGAPAPAVTVGTLPVRTPGAQASVTGEETRAWEAPVLAPSSGSPSLLPGRPIAQPDLSGPTVPNHPQTSSAPGYAGVQPSSSASSAASWQGGAQSSAGQGSSEPAGQHTYQQPGDRQPAQQPSYQQPTYQQPTYQQPTYQQPTYQQPTYQQPGYQQVGHQGPSYGEPGYGQATYGQPGPAQPSSQQPTYREPQQPTYREPQQPTYQQPTYQQPAPEPSYQQQQREYRQPSYEPGYSSPGLSQMHPEPWAPDPLFGPAPILDGGSSFVATPIFDSISAWFATSSRRAADPLGLDPWATLEDQPWVDAGQRAAAAPVVSGSTGSGLPLRRPGANAVPSATDASSGMGALFNREPHRPDAVGVRRRLDGLQHGVTSARRLRRGESEEEDVAGGIQPIGAPSGSSSLRERTNGEPSRPDALGGGRGIEARNGDVRSTGVRNVEPRNVEARGADSRRQDARRSDVRGAGGRGAPDDEATVTQPVRREPRAGRTAARRDHVAQPAGNATTRARAREAGFDAFYRDFLPELLASLMIDGASPTLAADVAQAAMAEAHRSWRQIDVPEEWVRGRASAELARRIQDGTH
jgi:DNA-directed RNA polymerase specialized sigma24 family protein